MAMNLLPHSMGQYSEKQIKNKSSVKSVVLNGVLFKSKDSKYYHTPVGKKYP